MYTLCAERDCRQRRHMLVRRRRVGGEPVIVGTIKRPWGEFSFDGPERALHQGSPGRRLPGSLPDWQREIFSRVRDLVREADPAVQETIKCTVQPYFVLNGNICAFLAAKDHVNVFLYDPIASDPEGIITAGHDNKTGRQISYR